tara:strand:+ start:544 stop:714 length:171 start_codon:yes stop_codon:yes gene_type:complete
MNEVTELLNTNAERRITLAEKLHTNQITLESYRHSVIFLADREGKQIATLLGKLGK